MRRIQPSTSDARDARASEGTETVFTRAPTRRGACNTIRDVRRCARRRESPLFKTPRASKPSVWRRRVVCVVTHPRNRARLAALAVAERERERASPRRIPAAPSARTRRRRASRAVARVQRESGMRTPPRGVRARGFSSSGRCFRSSPSRRTASAVASSLRRRLRSASGPSARRNQRASVSGETSGRRIADRAPTSALSSHDPRRSDAPRRASRDVAVHDVSRKSRDRKS